MGVSATVSANEGNDKLLFQVCESPFRKLGSNKDIYAYNLLWMGSHGLLSTLCSANLQEYDKGKYISYLVLGSEMKLSDKAKAHLDVMNRASDHQAFWFRDCSVMAELSCTPTPQWNLFAKATYDVNKTNSSADYCVMPGTEITRVGGGLEFYPYRDDRLRLHANYCYTFGKNGNPDGVLADRQSQMDVGLTWRLDWNKVTK